MSQEPTSDNLQKRKWLLDHLDLLITEAAYHREHEDSEKLPGTTIWSGADDAPDRD